MSNDLNQAHPDYATIWLNQQAEQVKTQDTFFEAVKDLCAAHDKGDFIALLMAQERAIKLMSKGV